MNYDLTSPLGVFAYLADNNDLFKPLKEDYERTKQENEELKTEVTKLNEEKKVLAQNVLDLTTVVEAVVQQGGIS